MDGAKTTRQKRGNQTFSQLTSLPTTAVQSNASENANKSLSKVSALNTSAKNSKARLVDLFSVNSDEGEDRD